MRTRRFLLGAEMNGVSYKDTFAAKGSELYEALTENRTEDAKRIYADTSARYYALLEGLSVPKVVYHDPKNPKAWKIVAPDADIPLFPGAESWNGIHARIVGLPGFYKDFPNHYAVQMPWGLVTPAQEDKLRIPEPLTRGDLDNEKQMTEKTLQYPFIFTTNSTDEQYVATKVEHEYNVFSEEEVKNYIEQDIYIIEKNTMREDFTFTKFPVMFTYGYESTYIAIGMNLSTNLKIVCIGKDGEVTVINLDIDTSKLDVALEKAKELEATLLRIKELLA
uniref:ABC transporter substrate-binding protein n=1 Tax=Globodera pallida TaxID=36090 RepID=A0A183CPG6_GLOPA